MSSLANLQQLLSKVATQKSEVNSRIEPEPHHQLKSEAKKKEQLYSSLPSEINFSKQSSSKNVISNSVSVGGTSTRIEEKPKAKSYKSLLKMAKTITPAGMLVTKDSSLKPKESSSTSAAISSNQRMRHPIPLSIDNPHHPEYQRPANTSNSSLKYLKHPKTNVRVKAVRSSGKQSQSKIPKDLIMAQTKKRDLVSTGDIAHEVWGKKLKTEPIPRAKSLPPPNPIGNRKVSANPPDRRAKASDSLTRPIPPKPKLAQSRPIERSRADGGRRLEEARPHYSQAIQEIFGYNRSRYNYDSDEDSSDMEVNYRDLEREEKKSLRIGKREDLEEEQRELAKLKRKAR